MFTADKLKEVRDYLKTVSTSSSIYLGADSMRIKKNRSWFALYTVVVVVHLESKHGAKLFGYNVLESDYEKNPSRPMMRMMNEAYKVVELYTEIEDDIILMDTVEIHLDISPHEINGSNCAVKAAAGYILGSCGIEPKIKPNAFAASYAADRLVRGLKI
jgi:predicted RNase H-related nuclease YkuK (DUF458 family)